MGGCSGASPQLARARSGAARRRTHDQVWSRARSGRCGIGRDRCDPGSRVRHGDRHLCRRTRMVDNAARRLDPHDRCHPRTRSRRRRPTANVGPVDPHLPRRRCGHDRKVGHRVRRDIDPLRGTTFDHHVGQTNQHHDGSRRPCEVRGPSRCRSARTCGSLRHRRRNRLRDEHPSRHDHRETRPRILHRVPDHARCHRHRGADHPSDYSTRSGISSGRIDVTSTCSRIIHRMKTP